MGKEPIGRLMMALDAPSPAQARRLWKLMGHPDAALQALEELRASGTGLVEVEIEPGQTEVCVVTEGVSVCIGHLRLPDAGVRRVDVEYVDATGSIHGRANDVPVDREGGRVILACDSHVALMSGVATFRLVTHTHGARRVIATYSVKNVLAPS